MENGKWRETDFVASGNFQARLIFHYSKKCKIECTRLSPESRKPVSLVKKGEILSAKDVCKLTRDYYSLPFSPTFFVSQIHENF